MACISTGPGFITVHGGVLSGLTLLTSEQMEKIWSGVGPESGPASVSSEQLKMGQFK